MMRINGRFADELVTEARKVGAFFKETGRTMLRNQAKDTFTLTGDGIVQKIKGKHPAIMLFDNITGAIKRITRLGNKGAIYQFKTDTGWQVFAVENNLKVKVQMILDNIDTQKISGKKIVFTLGDFKFKHDNQGNFIPLN